MVGGQREADRSADPVRDKRFVDVFRFGDPALIFGATGPGPFGNRWLLDGKAAILLLDADLRFFGAMMIGLGFIFFLTIWKLEVYRPLIYVLACAVARWCGRKDICPNNIRQSGNCRDDTGGD